MFEDLPEGKTHYENDGCGEPAHNPLPNKEPTKEWYERLDSELDKLCANLPPSKQAEVRFFVKAALSAREEALVEKVKELPGYAFSTVDREDVIALIKG